MQTDRQTDMTKLTVAFSNSATAPTNLKKMSSELLIYSRIIFFLVVLDWSVHAP
jgi:hypothetical protein